MTCATASLPLPLPLQPEELEMLEPRERLNCAQWAQQRRQLSPKTSDLHGPWSHEYTPFLVEIMEALSDTGTRVVSLMKCSQSSGTEAGLNLIGWIIDEAPGPLIMVMPRQDDASRRVATRIIPMFESTPSLRRHLPGGRIDHINIGKETVLDNLIMYLAWAGSAAALADNPVCYVVLDEVGKYPAASGKEADPVSLAKKRQRTFYYRSKLYVPSTPVLENDLVDREFQRGDQRRWWVKCVHCGDRHVMNWKHVVLDNADGKLLAPEDYENGGHARYVCPCCGVCWSEKDRWRAVEAGRWAPAGCTVDAAGRIVGKVPDTSHRSYHINALMLYPRFQTVDNLAKEWAEAHLALAVGDIGPLQDFINSQLGEPWKQKDKASDLEQLRGHIGTYERAVVPAGVQMLTGGVDVQLDHVWVTVLGWGYLSEVWQLYEARIETGDTSDLKNYAQLAEFVRMTFPLADDRGQVMALSRVAIDCGYRSDVVLDFCRQLGRHCLPVRGDDSVRTSTYRAAKVSGGLQVRYDLNTTVLKDRLHRLLYAADPGPGYLHLHRETTDETLGHLTSEESQQIRRGRKTDILWAPKRSGLANHLWDAAVYATFAAELAGVRMLRDPSEPVATGRKVGVRAGYQR